MSPFVPENGLVAFLRRYRCVSPTATSRISDSSAAWFVLAIEGALIHTEIWLIRFFSSLVLNNNLVLPKLCVAMYLPLRLSAFLGPSCGISISTPSLCILAILAVEVLLIAFSGEAHKPLHALYFCCIVPIYEEVVFRYTAMAIALNRLPSSTLQCSALTAVAFALAHRDSALSCATALVAGFALSIRYVRLNRNLLEPLAIHVFHNLNVVYGVKE